MGVAIPQVITTDRSSNNQIFDGSLKFDKSKAQFLERTPSSAGNRKTWTYSAWFKRGTTPSSNNLWAAYNGTYSGLDNFGQNYWDAADGRFVLYQGGGAQYTSTARHRDHSGGWYHLVIACDVTQSSYADRYKVYVNNFLNTSSGGTIAQNTDLAFNNNIKHYIGTHDGGATELLDGNLTQVYLVDGKALGPEYFGFTDPLTNTWKPKKFDIRAENNPNNGTSWVSNTTSGSGTIANAYDGATNTWCNITSGNTFTLTPPSTIEADTVEVWLDTDTPASFSINGGTFSSENTYSGLQYVTVATNVSLTSLAIKGGTGGSGIGLRGIRINGYILLDSKVDNSFYLPLDGKSPIGHDKSKLNPINNGTVWSNLTSGGAINATYPMSQAFDGSTSTTAVRAVSGGGFVFGGSLGIKYRSKVRIHSGVSGVGTQQFKLNDGTATDMAENTFVTVATGSGTLNKLEITAGSTGNSNIYLGAVEVDGVILVDNVYGNGFTPVNFGGSVALDNPQVTGARPILNTTQGGTQAGIGVFGSKENKFYTVTTANGSVYQFDITSGDNPSLEFIRGATYRFDYTSHSGHPLRFSSTNPDSSTTAYTEGTNTSVSNVITITVPHDAPDTLYYYCTAHASAMNGAISVTTDNTKADQYASNCVFAVPCVGSNNDLSASINCTSSTKAVTTRNNAAASSDTSNFYSGSFEFDGTDDDFYADTPGAIGTGDFTLECWVYFNNLSGNQGVVDTRTNSNTNGFALLGRSNGTVSMADGTSLIGDAISASAGRWIHLAGSRSGSSLKFFVDGKLSSTVTNSTNFSNDNIIVGTIGGGTEDLNGYVQDVRLYLGVAKYTSDFVVPATSPDILPDTPSGVVGGTKLAKYPSTDGGSTTFGKETSKLTNSGDFAGISGTGDYTISFWFYANDFSSSDNNGSEGGFLYIFDQGNSHPTYAIKVDITKTGKVIVVDSANFGPSWLSTFDYASDYNTDHNVVLGKWNYIHVYRSSGTLYIYNNGGLQLSKSQSSSSPSRYKLDICSNTSNVILKDLRVTNTAITDPTPPTSPLTADSDTQLLICHGNGLTDISGNSNTLSATGTVKDSSFNPFTTNIDKVRGQETGYNTFDPLLNRGNNTLSNGNTFVTGGSNWNTTLCTGVIESGKWFVELTHRGRQSASDNDIQFGLFGLNDPEDAYPLASTKDLAAQSTGYVIVDAQAQWYNNSSSTSYGNTWSTPGDVVGLRYNADTGKLGFIINGVDQGDISSTLSTSQRWVVGISLRGGGAKAEINFGQKPFKFPPPDGFLPLNAANVRPEIVISRPDQYVGVSTGNFDTQKTFVTGFQPDLVWFKSRSNTDAHILQDSVRGVNSYLISSSQNGAGTFPVGGQYGLTSFNYNGWTHAAYGAVANSAQVAWSWKAGGNKNTFNVDDVGYASAAAAGLDGGSITPTGASVGTKQGFSIIKFTNTTSDSTQSHGLTQKPDFIIWKKTSGSSHWAVYHSGIGATKYTYLNLTNAAATGSEFWNNTEPTSSLVTTRAEPHSFGSAGDTIMYLWHDVPGLQKFGTYTSTAVSDGPYVELGFRPAVVWCKNTGTNANNTITGWSIYFNKQNSTERNSNVSPLFANANGAGGTRGDGSESGHTLSSIDFLSNGFKIRSTSAEVNTNTGADVYVYCAWAEAPSIDLYGGGANAR